MKREKYIDHTLLKPDAGRAAIQKICDEAKAYDFASVCVNPVWVSYAAGQLTGTDVKTCAVIGFPLGALTPEMKASQAAAVIADGAQEVDMVINIGAAKDGDWELVQRDIAAVTAAAKDKALVKVIIEACLLTDEEKVQACLAAKAAGADFVKTSTGFSTGGATAEDVALMRRTVGPEMGVKAAGGIRTREDMDRMIEAGATRIGTSAGTRLV